MSDLKTHDIILEGSSSDAGKIRLRPLTEKDWELLLIWDNDPEVLYYAEGDDISGYTLDEIKSLYCSVCVNAFCFIIEFNEVPIGECWLQEMNLPRILEKYSHQDVRRIDLAIGEKEYWNKGIGTAVIRLLTAFGFQDESADLIYEPEIGDYNLRSLKAFQKVGYEVAAIHEEAPGQKAKVLYDLVLTRNKFLMEKG